MNDCHEKLKKYWARTGAGISVSKTPEAEIIKLEQKYGIKIPADFKKYLTECNPNPNNLDEEVTYWWPIQELKNIPEEYQNNILNNQVKKEAEYYLFFADCMVWCWAWAICCKQGGNFGKVVQIGNGDEFVADSFTEFVDFYILGNPKLF